GVDGIIIAGVRSDLRSRRVLQRMNVQVGDRRCGVATILTVKVEKRRLDEPTQEQSGNTQNCSACPHGYFYNVSSKRPRIPEASIPSETGRQATAAASRGPPEA